MSNNLDTQAVQRFHEGTKHPGGFLMNPRHLYHPALEPLPFKIYQNLEPIPLPLDTSTVGMSALEAIAAPPGSSDESPLPDLSVLARLLYFSAGITKRIQYLWGERYFRAAACTGALYHIELYAMCTDLPGLDAGVYHYEPQNNTLVCLRSGDFRSVLAEESGNEPHIAAAPLILVYSDVWWRNAVKYQARAYRHTFWDGGTVLAHTLALCAAHGLPSHLVLGFADEPTNHLLGLDTSEEAAFALLAVGHVAESPLPAPSIKPLDLTVEPISDRQIPIQPILDIHAASSLPDGPGAAAWRNRSLPPPEYDVGESALPLVLPDELPPDPVEEVIIRRGSTRRFSRRSITLTQLSILLQRSTRGLAADFLTPYSTLLNVPYLIINAVEGLASGAYVCSPAQAALELIREGDFRDQAGGLALGQDLAADAAANIYFLINLEQVLDAYGNRGYRAAQMEAAISAGRMYLAAYSQGFGATGLTFYDDTVIRFFAPHGKDSAVMFLLAVGHKASRLS